MKIPVRMKLLKVWRLATIREHYKDSNNRQRLRIEGTIAAQLLHFSGRSMKNWKRRRRKL